MLGRSVIPSRRRVGQQVVPGGMMGFAEELERRSVGVNQKRDLAGPLSRGRGS